VNVYRTLFSNMNNKTYRVRSVHDLPTCDVSAYATKIYIFKAQGRNYDLQVLNNLPKVLPVLLNRDMLSVTIPPRQSCIISSKENSDSDRRLRQTLLYNISNSI